MAIFLFLSFAELFPGPYKLSLSGVEQWSREGLSGVKQQNNVEMWSQLFFLQNSKPNFSFFNLIVERGHKTFGWCLGALNAPQHFHTSLVE